MGWGDRRMDVHTYVCRDRQTYVQTDGRTDSPCVLQDFVPFGAAAQKEEEEERKEEENIHKNLLGRDTIAEIASRK